MMSIDADVPRSGRADPRARARWYNAVWRWHFYAGLFCVPFVLWLSLTGLIYLWRPQVEAWLDRPYDRLPVAGRSFSPDARVAAALAAVPGGTLARYVVPRRGGEATRVIVARPDGERRVILDPRSLAVLTVEAEDRRPFEVLMRLHGELLAGTIGSIVVEVAACWAVVLLLTGIFLWWPRGRRGFAGVLYPRLRIGRRAFWRDLHAVSGLWVSLLALGLIGTGLPWAAGWGNYLGAVRALTGSAEGPVDWTIGGRPPRTADAAPAHHAGHAGAPPPPIVPGELTRVAAAVAPLAIAPPVLIAPPAHAGAPWKVSSGTADRPERTDVEVDGRSGRVLGRIDFADRHWIDRAVGYGIAAHEGALFGLANQLLGSATALLLAVLASSGAITWWRRRPPRRLGAPLPLERPRHGAGTVAAIVALAVAMPMFGATLLLVLLVDATLIRRIAALRRWIGCGDEGRSPRVAGRSTP